LDQTPKTPGVTVRGFLRRQGGIGLHHVKASWMHSWRRWSPG